MTHPIEASALRIGMFVHLNVGWMSHPFPLSSFRISSDEQIGIIRSLRIRELRWSAEQSALHDAQDRAACGQVAPPDGLFLVGVDYPDEF